MERKPHIAVVSVPAFSHQASILEFCKRVTQLHPDFHVTCIIPVLGSLPKASKSILAALPSFNIDIIVLPPENIPQGIVPALQIPLAMSRSLPSIQNALKSLSSTSLLVALVADYLAYEAIEFAKELDVLSYIYFPSAASVLSLCLHSSKLDETITCEYRELPEPINIPGCIVPIHGRDLPTSLQDRSSEVYKHFLRRSKALHLAHGILVNSFVELEAEAVRAMQEESSIPTIYPVGPIVQTGPGSWEIGSDCLRWLDKQAPRSVLYVSFGSGGTLSQDQMNELALGLELSGKKFVWVVREPNDLPSAMYFSGSEMEPLQFLPSGFLERTKNQGLVIPFWAPQAQILSHNATGGFLTQCGWNSILESVMHGLPIMVWPLFAEQRMNAAMLTNGLKVALRPKVNENGVVERDEIAKVIRSLMMADEGKGIRKRMMDLKDAAVDALQEDGSSTKTITQMATKWKSLGLQ